MDDAAKSNLCNWGISLCESRMSARASAGLPYQLKCATTSAMSIIKNELLNGVEFAHGR